MKLHIILFLLFVPVVSAIGINEIMYNPEGDDSNNEWIEIFDPNQTNLEDWTIGDLKSNDTLIPLFIADSSYSIIVSSNVSNFSNFSIYYAGSTIGNGLGNSGDTIFLYDLNKTLIDFVNYTNEFANGNNKTLEKFNNSWHESLADGGTPGFNNSVFYFFENNETINNTNTSNETNATEINQVNETVCIASISINTTKEIFIEEAVKFKHIVNSSEDFSIIYWVEDLFGNIVKDEYETKTLTQKSFTPKPEENDRCYVIKSILKGCEEAYVEKIVIYRKNEEITEEENEENDEEDSEEEETETKQKFDYALIDYSKEILQNTEANAVVKIDSDDETHLIKLSAYLYRGSKKYSEIAEYEFTIEKLESEAVELRFFTNASQGEYKMKVKINKDNQKTDYELTSNVTVVGNKEIEETEQEKIKGEIIPEKENNKTEQINITNEPIIYKSAKAKSEALIPIIIIAILAVVSAVLIWKR